MDTSTQTPTVMATPQSGNLAATPGATPPVGTLNTTGMDPITAAILGALNLGTSGSEYNLAKSIAGNATSGTNNALGMLSKFLSDPSSITSMPGYQFGMDQGLDAVNRGAGALGMLNSGNRLAALQKQGQAYAGTWMDRMFQELMGNVQENVAGGQLDLGAGNLMMRGLQDKNTALTGGAAGILQGISGLLTQGSPLWNMLIKAIGGGGGGGSGGGYPIGSPGNPAPGPGDPTPGGSGGVGGPGDPGGPMDPGFGIDPWTPVPQPIDWTSGFDVPGMG